MLRNGDFANLFYVYALVFPNGKRYVGLTSLTPAKRFEGHKKAARAKSRLPVHQALNSFGPRILRALMNIQRHEVGLPLLLS